MATDANGNEIQANEKVTFTPEQQARVDAIVKESMGRAGGELRVSLEKVTAEKTQLEADLAAAKAAVKAAVTPLEKKAAKEDVDALNNQIVEMKTIQTTTQTDLERHRKLVQDKDAEIAKAKDETVQVKKQVAIQTAANKAGFVDVNIVSKLTDDLVKFDGTRGRFVVLNEQGTERLNSSYEPMSLEEFYKEYAANNPFLVKSDVKGGAGSSQNTRSNFAGSGKYEVTQIFGKTSNGALANKLAQENPQEYHRMKIVAKEAGIIA